MIEASLEEKSAQAPPLLILLMPSDQATWTTNPKITISASIILAWHVDCWSRSPIHCSSVW